MNEHRRRRYLTRPWSEDPPFDHWPWGDYPDLPDRIRLPTDLEALEALLFDDPDLKIWGPPQTAVGHHPWWTPMTLHRDANSRARQPWSAGHPRSIEYLVRGET